MKTKGPTQSSTSKGMNRKTGGRDSPWIIGQGMTRNPPKNERRAGLGGGRIFLLKKRGGGGREKGFLLVAGISWSSLSLWAHQTPPSINYQQVTINPQNLHSGRVRKTILGEESSANR